MKYQAAIVMLPRLLNKEDAMDYVCGKTMLDLLEVQPVRKLKGLSVYDRLELDRAIDKLRHSEAANELAAAS